MAWHNLDQIINSIPFVGLATIKAGEHLQRPFTTRVVEGLIMGVAGGALGAYVTLKVVETKVEGISSVIVEMKADVNRLEMFHMKP